jgi:hypothetical protein
VDQRNDIKGSSTNEITSGFRGPLGLQLLLIVKYSLLISDPAV